MLTLLDSNFTVLWHDCCGLDVVIVVQWTAVQDWCRCHTCSWDNTHLTDRLSAGPSVEKSCSVLSRRRTHWVSIALYT